MRYIFRKFVGLTGAVTLTTLTILGCQFPDSNDKYEVQKIQAVQHNVAEVDKIRDAIESIDMEIKGTIVNKRCDVQIEENVADDVVYEEIAEPIYEEPVLPEPVPMESSETQSPGGYVGTYDITAYTWTGNPMANGEYPYYGSVASCDFPLGTTLYIEGVGTFIVNDVCPTSGVIDVYMDSYESCIQFGRMSANVYVQ